MKKLSILGTRGIPAHHGGFETFAEHLALYLIRKDWGVTVYCQDEGTGDCYENDWNGVRLVHIPIKQSGAFGTMLFDLKSTLHAASERNLILTLGYNTAIFCIAYRLRGITNLINMDGIEWKRDKWSTVERRWLHVNERAGCLLGNHLIADHPEIRNHLAARVRGIKISMIPYGADTIRTSDPGLARSYGLVPDKYAIIIARPEPENSILEIVRAFSCKRRGIELAVLGDYAGSTSEYQQSVLNAASDEVRFLGAVYERPIINSLRFHTLLYIHGHTVGGTNPSLVEALGAGNAVLAHDNPFNRWVAGTGSHYFRDERECSLELDSIIENAYVIAEMKLASRQNHQNFTWEGVLREYEALLNRRYHL